jgi:hypothetical protein
MSFGGAFFILLAERGVVDGTSASLYMSRKTGIKKFVLYRMLLTFDVT